MTGDTYFADNLWAHLTHPYAYQTSRVQHICREITIRFQCEGNPLGSPGSHRFSEREHDNPGRKTEQTERLSMLHSVPKIGRVRNLVNNALEHRECALLASRQIAAAAIRVLALATLIFLRFFLRARVTWQAAFRKHGLLLPSAPKREGCSAHKPRRAAPPRKKPWKLSSAHARTHAYSRGNRTALCTLFVSTAALTLSCREPWERSTRSQPEHAHECAAGGTDRAPTHMLRETNKTSMHRSSHSRQADENGGSARQRMLTRKHNRGQL